MSNIYKLESLLDHFIESDPDRAERWIESTLAKIELRKRLAHRKAVTPPPNTAQQEPLAWFELLREARDNCKASIVEEGISASRKKYRIDLEARLTAALNTSPPASKPWVGLTEQERNDLEDCCEMTIGKAAFEAIEAKLREKNT